MKKHLLLFLATLLPMMASADDSGTCGDNVTWTYVEATHTLTISGEGSMSDYSYGSNAPWYSYCSNNTKVFIEDGVTSIGYYAFRGCSGLTSITIPNSVTRIGDWAFSGCSSLISITIPNGVTSIGACTFSGCSGLTSITIPNSVTSIGQQAFSVCSGLTSITIPNGVTIIGRYAFLGCSSLTSVTIPNSVTSIGGNAFEYCSGLTSVTIPNSVTTIGDYAFAYCEGLTSITIPNSVTSIGEQAFEHCSNATSLKLPDNLQLIRQSTFYYCSKLKSVTIPSAVEVIYQKAFAGCNSLESVTSQATTPPFLYDNSFSNYSVPLNVPSGCKSAYEDAQGWRNFTNVSDGIVYDRQNITLENDIQTYCSLDDMDFSGTDEIKAYIVSAFKPSTGEVTLTRITDVPANTGIVVKGAAGTYTIPMGPGETIVSNMLRGVTTNTVLNKVEGDYTNYVLAKKNGNLGFYAVVDGSTLSAGKAYLPLPTASLPSGARSIKLVFEDGGTTGISEASPLNDNGEMINDNVYDLQGRRVTKPTHGLYVVNGRKVVIK